MKISNIVKGKGKHKWLVLAALGMVGVVGYTVLFRNKTGIAPVDEELTDVSTAPVVGEELTDTRGIIGEELTDVSGGINEEVQDLGYIPDKAVPAMKPVTPVKASAYADWFQSGYAGVEEDQNRLSVA